LREKLGNEAQLQIQKFFKPDMMVKGYTDLYKIMIKETSI